MMPEPTRLPVRVLLVRLKPKLENDTVWGKPSTSKASLKPSELPKSTNEAVWLVIGVVSTPVPLLYEAEPRAVAVTELALSAAESRCTVALAGMAPLAATAAARATAAREMVLITAFICLSFGLCLRRSSIDLLET